MDMPQVPDGAPAYQGRVVAEKAELDERLGKLLAFMESEGYASLAKHERKLLAQQSLHMKGYSAVLGERIEAFKS